MDKGSNLVGGNPSAPPNRHPKYSALLDLSNFDINAVLRGMQLTLVGGTSIQMRKNSELLFRVTDVLG